MARPISSAWSQSDLTTGCLSDKLAWRRRKNSVFSRLKIDPPTRLCCLGPVYTARARAARVHGVVRHVLANGSASFQSRPNHANTFRPNPADRAIPQTKDLRAETCSFGALKPNTFTCARVFVVSRARERVWKAICHLRLLAFAGMFGREGSSRLHHSDQEVGDPSVLERRLLGEATYSSQCGGPRPCSVKRPSAVMSPLDWLLHLTRVD